MYVYDDRKYSNCLYVCVWLSQVLYAPPPSRFCCMYGCCEGDSRNVGVSSATNNTTTNNATTNNATRSATTTTTTRTINLHGQYTEEVDPPTNTGFLCFRNSSGRTIVDGDGDAHGNGDDRSCWKAFESNQPMVVVVCILSGVLIAIVIFVAVFLSQKK